MAIQGLWGAEHLGKKGSDMTSTVLKRKLGLLVTQWQSTGYFKQCLTTGHRGFTRAPLGLRHDRECRATKPPARPRGPEATRPGEGRSCHLDTGRLGARPRADQGRGLVVPWGHPPLSTLFFPSVKRRGYSSFQTVFFKPVTTSPLFPFFV